MCFVKICKETLVAETDMEVYKVFRKVSCFNKPYYYTGPYQIDYIYDDLNGEYECDDFGDVKVSGYVGFHSFENFFDAVKFMDDKSSWKNEDEDFEIVPCVIPKGTKYYGGCFLNMSSYVSEKIKLKY